MAGKDTTKPQRVWNVQFVDDYAIITATSIEGSDEDEAVENAIIKLLDYYEIDAGNWMIGEVEELE